jgi:Leucine-rich repeat (LRR) protein
MENLSKLVLDHNRLTMFDASFFPQLTHLSLDNNSIKSIAGLKQLHQLDSFSLRNQDGEKTQVFYVSAICQI